MKLRRKRESRERERSVDGVDDAYLAVGLAVLVAFSKTATLYCLAIITCGPITYGSQELLSTTICPLPFLPPTLFATYLLAPLPPLASFIFPSHMDGVR